MSKVLINEIREDFSLIEFIDAFEYMDGEVGIRKVEFFGTCGYPHNQRTILIEFYTRNTTDDDATWAIENALKPYIEEGSFKASKMEPKKD